MLKKQMRPCYKCDHCSSDERCKIAAVLRCYYNPTEFGNIAPLPHERPPLRMFKRRTEQRVFLADFIGKLEDGISCLACDAVTSADTLVCNICAAKLGAKLVEVKES